MIDFKFEMQKSCRVHTHPEIELFYVLDGSVVFSMEERQCRLQQDDFLIVNSESRHSWSSDDEVLSACLHISAHELARLLKQNLVVFWCNSAVEQNEQYRQVRSILKKIFSEHFKGTYRDEIYLNSLYYELLHCLTHEFLLNREDQRYEEVKHKYVERKHQISEYVRMNYDKPISLQELADKLYLSNAYLSKYIKRQFGMSFLEYVNSVRLSYAITELIYSDKPVVRIAMDTGFANSAAFNKAFKKKYQMTPSAYRVQWKDVEEKSMLPPQEEKQIEEKLEHYFASHPMQQDDDLGYETVSLMDTEPLTLPASWNEMINVGAAADLLDSDMQEHILWLKKKLHFRYARFWDLYEKQMFLDKHELGREYNFGKLDRVLDFLVTNGMKPHIELGGKTKKVLRSRKKVLIGETDPGWFSDDRLLAYFMEALITHLIKRYGRTEVAGWRFELWMREDNHLAGDRARRFAAQEQTRYFMAFDAIADVLKSYLPEVQFGGSGVSMQYGGDFFLNYLDLWSYHRHTPDFLAVYLFPYVPAEEDERVHNQSMDENFMQHRIGQIREILEKSELRTRDIYVTEWNFTVSNRNVLNDSCTKGAYLLKNMIDTVRETKALSYWVASDLFADYYDSGAPLNGSSGLLTKDRIAKPSYYAFDFMNRLGSMLHDRSAHAIVTDNGDQKWRIACHNYKHFNYQYCLSNEDEIPLREINNLLSDVRRQRICFDLPVAEDGSYRLKLYSVNQDHGSVQDEWIRMETPGELSHEDLDYLERISIPRMVIRRLEAQEGRIRFETVLEPNEIQFIQLVKN